jgi:subtilisin family serine protease
MPNYPGDPLDGTREPSFLPYTALLTDRWLVLLGEGGEEELQRLTGLTLMQAPTEDDADAVTLEEADGVVFGEIGVATIRTDPDRAAEVGVAASGENPEILAVEQAQMLFVAEHASGTTAEAPAPSEYMSGFLEGATSLARGLGLRAPSAGSVLAPPTVTDETQVAWGLQATNVAQSHCNGHDVRVAVLDTGMTMAHPDFAERKIIGRSFVPGETVEDGHGHGTHCIGTACGPLRPPNLPRYGVAPESTIYAGKVLSNRGSGSDDQILAGINWAVANRCRIVSMSLGAPTQVGEAFSPIYEAVARRAQAAGTLIIAAAGNTGPFGPVNRPANCPSIMAVAAVDVRLQVANFSSPGRNPGGQVDIAGPGVDVYSTWPMPTRYRRLSGTSMATPHVAGVAALLAEANPEAAPSDLWTRLTGTARQLPLPSRMVGAGLVQAPQCVEARSPQRWPGWGWMGPGSREA